MCRSFPSRTEIVKLLYVMVFLLFLIVIIQSAKLSYNCDNYTSGNTAHQSWFCHTPTTLHLFQTPPTMVRTNSTHTTRSSSYVLQKPLLAYDKTALTLIFLAYLLLQLFIFNLPHYLPLTVVKVNCSFSFGSKRSNNYVSYDLALTSW